MKTAHGMNHISLSETDDRGVKAGNKKSGRSREHELEREYPLVVGQVTHLTSFSQ